MNGRDNAESVTQELCWSRGPRIGDSGTPYCKLPHPHQGLHHPAPEDGWDETVVWGEPALRCPPSRFDGGAS